MVEWMDGMKSWERLPSETPRAFSAFCFYRDTPLKDRGIRACAEAYYETNNIARVGLWYRWSSKYDWYARAKAWDQEQNRLRREALREAILEMQERHARAAVIMQEKALLRLKAIDPAELSPSIVLQYLVEAARIERDSRGVPESVPSVVEINDEDLQRKYGDILAAVDGFGDGEETSDDEVL